MFKSASCVHPRLRSACRRVSRIGLCTPCSYCVRSRRKGSRAACERSGFNSVLIQRKRAPPNKENRSDPPSRTKKYRRTTRGSAASAPRRRFVSDLWSSTHPPPPPLRSVDRPRAKTLGSQRSPHTGYTGHGQGQEQKPVGSGTSLNPFPPHPPLARARLFLVLAKRWLKKGG